MAEIKLPDSTKYPPAENVQFMRKRPDPVLNNSQAAAKDSFLKRVFGGFMLSKTNDIMTYLYEDIVKPTLKDLLYNLIVGGAGMSIYNDSRASRARGSDWGSRRDYAGVSRGRSRDRFNSADSGSSRQLERNGYNEWRLYNEYDEMHLAEGVLAALIRQIDTTQQHTATIGDFLSANGVEGWDWVLDDWGWTNLDNVVVKYRLGKFRIMLPDPVYLKGRQR